MYSQFRNPRIVSGWDSLSELSELAGRRAALISDAGVMEELGFVDRARRCLDQAGIEAKIVGRIGREPHIPDIQPLIEGLCEYSPEWIVALGGGSVLDAAKTAWAFYEYPKLGWDEAFRFEGLPESVKRARLPTAQEARELFEKAYFGVLPDWICNE